MPLRPPLSRPPLLLVLAALTAPGVAAADPPAPPAAAAVAVPDGLAVFGPDGIRVGADVVFRGPVESAALDAAQDLIWFTSGDTLQVIDLRATARKPIAIVKRMATSTFEISGFSSATGGSLYTNAYPVVVLGKKPRIMAMDGVYAVVDPPAARKLARAIKKSRIVGAAWIRANRRRIAKPVAAPRADPPAMTLPAGTAHCDDYSSDCGNVYWLGDSPYQLVVTMGACGDACYRGCALYDPARTRFAPAGQSGAWGPLTEATEQTACDALIVSSSHDAYATDAKVCALSAAAVACTDLAPWTAFGWTTPAASTPVAP